MSHPYTSEEIDQIEEELRSLELQDENVEIIKQVTRIELIENE